MRKLLLSMLAGFIGLAGQALAQEAGPRDGNRVPANVLKSSTSGGADIWESDGAGAALVVIKGGSVTITGDASVDQGAATVISEPWPVILSDGSAALGTAGNPVRTDPTGSTTQPVSGTVTSDQGASGVDSDPWNIVVRNNSGTELGTTSNPFRIRLTNGSGADIGEFGSRPMVSGGVNPSNVAEPFLLSGSGTIGIMEGTLTSDNFSATSIGLPFHPPSQGTRMPASALYGFDGTDWDRLRVRSGGFLRVNGDVADDAADDGDPVKMGGIARNAARTNVADGDRVDATYDLQGRQSVTGAVRGSKVRKEITLSDTTETTLIDAGGAGVFHDIDLITVQNTSTTVPVGVIIRDATSGSVIMTIGAATSRRPHTVPFSLNGLEQTTANNNWTAELTATPTGGQVTVFAQAHKVQ